MPSIALVDQAMSAGGGQRFTEGLVEGLLLQPDIGEWDLTLLINPRASGRYRVRWPERLKAPNLEVEEVRVSIFWRRLLNRTANPQPVLGVPGSVGAQRLAHGLLKRFGTRYMVDYQARFRHWAEGYFSRRRFDLVYFSWPYFMECPETRAPFVCTPHDFNFKHFQWHDSEDQRRVEANMPRWLEKAGGLVVSSDFIAGELRGFYPRQAHKVRVVRLGIPSSGIEPSRAEVEECRLRLGLPGEFVMTAGWMAPHKNLTVVLDAMGRLKARGLGVPLVCTGPQSELLRPGNRAPKSRYASGILEEVRRLGFRYGEDYYALGYVEQFDLDCLYRMAALLVVPSLYDAGSFPVREAMRAGCPVAMSRIPALLEEYELLEGNAWLFDPVSGEELSETILGVLSDSDGTAAKTRRASLIAPQVFSWEKTGRGYLDAFKDVLGGLP